MKKVRIFNSINTNTKKVKRKYFKVEKNRGEKKDKKKESELKKIFRTKKEFHILKKKTKRTSINNERNMISAEQKEKEETEQDNSFLVLKIVPKRLKLVKIRKNKKNKIDESQNKLIFKNCFKRSVSNDDEIRNNINNNINGKNNNHINIIENIANLNNITKINNGKSAFSLNNNLNLNYGNLNNINNLNFVNNLNNSIKENINLCNCTRAFNSPSILNSFHNISTINNKNINSLIGKNSSEKISNLEGIENEKNNCVTIQNHRIRLLLSNNYYNNNIIYSNLNSRIQMKLQVVYFYHIKNLCKYINQILSDLSTNDKNLNLEIIHQIYQSLQILDKKINDFKLDLKKQLNELKEFHIKKEEFLEILSLKENLLFMKKTLNNSLSQNLSNIYTDIERFCNEFLK